MHHFSNRKTTGLEIQALKMELNIFKRHPESRLVYDRKEKAFFAPAFCIFCREQLYANNLFEDAPEGLFWSCPQCGDELSPDEVEELRVFRTCKNSLVYNSKKRIFFAPASCLFCREPMQALCIDEATPNGMVWYCPACPVPSDIPF